MSVSQRPEDPQLLIESYVALTGSVGINSRRAGGK